MFRIQVHIANDDPVVLDVEELPKPDDQFVMGMNPQRRDGKDVPYVLPEVTTIILPMWRISLIQLLPSAEEEQVPTFVRE